MKNFTLFSEHKAGLVKIIGQNHQLLGVNNAIASMLAARKLGHGRGGVFWRRQFGGRSGGLVEMFHRQVNDGVSERLDVRDFAHFPNS